MTGHINRRSLLKGSAGLAGAAAISKRSTSFAAPAVIKQTGSTIDITYWGSFADILGEAEQEVVNRFNESQQDVRVTYEFQGNYEETAQKLTAALAARQVPDVALLSDVWWFKFYLSKALAPLDEFIDANEYTTSDVVDSLLVEGNREGQQFWLPFARSTPLFYYNVDMFEEAGLTDGPPETWSEFEEVAPSLVNESEQRVAFAHPSSGSYIAWLFQGVTWAFGGRYSDQDFNIHIAEPEAVAAGEFYRRSVADGWASTPDDIVADFASGLTAAMMASTGSLTGVKEQVGDSFNFRTAFLLKEKEIGVCTGGAGLSVMAGAPPEKQEAAFKFIAFATSPEITTFWSQATGYMPVRKSAVESEEMQAFFEENPNFRTAVEQLPLTQPQDAARVFIPNGDQIIGRGLEEITINLTEAQVALEDVAAVLEEEAQPIIEQIEAL
jgi:sn-glycerol 3-phosphate transport system substrate-binding protein